MMKERKIIPKMIFWRQSSESEGERYGGIVIPLVPPLVSPPPPPPPPIGDPLGVTCMLPSMQGRHQLEKRSHVSWVWCVWTGVITISPSAVDCTLRSPTSHHVPKLTVKVSGSTPTHTHHTHHTWIHTHTPHGYTPHMH